MLARTQDRRSVVAPVSTVLPESPDLEGEDEAPVFRRTEDGHRLVGNGQEAFDAESWTTAAAKGSALAATRASKIAWPTGLVSKSGKPVLCHEPPTLPINNLCNICADGAVECVAVMVRFKWSGKWGGEEVAISGTFNDWDVIPVERSPNGDYVLFLTLEPGTYQYKFRVDGRWLTSLEEPRVSDGRNNMNNQVTVAEAVTYKWKKEWGGEEVFVVGNDTNWTERLRMERDDQGDFVLSKSLPVGSYYYKFLVDGQWRCSPEEPTQINAQNLLNNCVTVAADASVTLFYKTGWDKPRLVLPGTVDPEDPTKPVEIPFAHTQSTGWMRVSVPVAPGYIQQHTNKRSGAEADGTCGQVNALEFVVSEGVEDGSSDVPPHGGVYDCPHPGGYKLLNGYLIPFPKARSPPVMVCTDLDGTLIGDDADFDAGTAAFTHYWEDTAGLAGGVLVFNTGRSIGKVCSLFVEKAGLLAVPKAVITAVGTKIFERNMKYPPEMVEGWDEDLSWAERLDEGWDLEVVREVCEAAVSGGEWKEQVWWLDRGTEHPHRCSLSVHLPRLDDLLLYLKNSFAEAGLTIKVIVSGEGDWRYVDCVADNAGKLQALNYVRKKYSIPKERCAACGDSGNDTLMLAGENPAIVVGNAQPDLRAWVLNQPQDGRVVLTENKGAAGILEGLASLQLY